MIYQLIKRDPAWKAAAWAVPICALSWTFAPLASYFGVIVILMALLTALPYQRATAFEAGLPIAARDLILGRALAILALIWISAGAAAGGVLLARGFGPEAARPLGVGALGTLYAAITLSVRPKEVAGPRWVLFPLFLILPAAGPRIVDRGGVLLPALCALAGVALLAWLWLSAPRSFQLAPAKAEGGGITSEAAVPAERGGRTPAWAPVLRSAFSWQYLFFAAMTGLGVAGSWAFVVFWVVMAWASSRARMRWLWTLPARRRALLWTLLGPILAAAAAGFIASFYGRTPPPTEPRVVMMMAAALLATVLLGVLLTSLLDWRGLSPRARKRTVFGILGLWYAAAVGILFSPLPSTVIRDALVSFSRALPFGPAALTAISAALLFGLYAAVEKVFREPDFADKPKAQTADAFGY